MKLKVLRICFFLLVIGAAACKPTGTNSCQLLSDEIRTIENNSPELNNIIQAWKSKTIEKGLIPIFEENSVDLNSEEIKEILSSEHSCRVKSSMLLEISLLEGGINTFNWDRNTRQTLDDDFKSVTGPVKSSCYDNTLGLMAGFVVISEDGNYTLKMGVRKK
jgi:hypothetical protein